jgi:hypothetical protein
MQSYISNIFSKKQDHQEKKQYIHTQEIGIVIKETQRHTTTKRDMGAYRLICQLYR